MTVTCVKAKRERVFIRATWVAVLAAFGLMAAFGPLWGLLPMVCFAVFSTLY
jgi:hypothetical protein